MYQETQKQFKQYKR